MFPVIASGVHFGLERLDLLFQRLVFFHLASKEATGQRRLLGNAFGREQVDVLELILAVQKVLHLHKALVDQGVEAVVQATHAHAEVIGQLALGEIGVFLQDAHDPEMGVFLDLGLAAGHGLWRRWYI